MIHICLNLLRQCDRTLQPTNKTIFIIPIPVSQKNETDVIHNTSFRPMINGLGCIPMINVIRLDTRMKIDDDWIGSHRKLWAVFYNSCQKVFKS